AIFSRPKSRRVGVEPFEDAHGPTHDDRQQTILQEKSALVHALAPKHRKENCRILSKTITQICRVNVDILKNGLIHSAGLEKPLHAGGGSGRRSFTVLYRRGR